MLEQIHHCRGAWGGGGAGKGGGVGVGVGTRAYLSASANPPSLQRGMERVRGGWWWWGGGGGGQELTEVIPVLL